MNQEKVKANTYSEVYESCSECGKNMYRVSQIYVDKNDRYICRSCKDKYNIMATKALDYDIGL